MNNIDLLIEKYLIEKYWGATDRGVELYVNPTAMNFREMKIWPEIRFIINADTNKCFVWNSIASIHVVVFNYLVSKREFDGPTATSFKEVYNRLDVIAGYAKVQGNKMRIRHAYSNDVDETGLKAVVKKLFTNPEKLFVMLDTPNEYL